MPKVERTCEVCGTTFLAPASSIKWGRGRMCGRPCANKRRMRTPEERFWKHVDRAGGTDVCWLWTGHLTEEGYGQFGGEGWHMIPAHRFAFQLANGPIPDGLLIRHKCNNPPCVNPMHLLAGTNQDNMDDRTAAGHTPRGEDAGRAILTETAVLEIREKRAHGVPLKQLAKEYGVCYQNIACIVSRQTWKHI
jgi:hypothetical protein